MKRLSWYIFLLLLVSCNSRNEENKPKPQSEVTQMVELYAGTYTRKEGHVDGKAKGIHRIDFNLATGELTNLRTIEGSINPSFITLHPNGDYLYAVNETGDPNTDAGGDVSVYEKVDNQWSLIQTVSSGGKWPCHISMDNDGNHVYVANYNGQWSKYLVNEMYKLEIIEIMSHAYAPSDHPRQDGAHAHMCLAFEDRVYVPDLGNNETIIFSNEDDENIKLGSLRTKAYSGPRHMAIHHSGSYGYVLNELSNTIDVFDVSKESETEIRHIQEISAIGQRPLQGEQAASAIKIHPNQKFLYTTSRGVAGSEQNTIDLFHMDDGGKKLKYITAFDCGGRIPRDFTIDPTGKYLLVANQDSDNIVVFEIDQGDGRLEKTETNFTLPTPVCLVFS